MAVRPPEVVETFGAYRFATIGAIRCVVFVEPESQETYWLLRDVCAIPSDVGLRLELVNVCAIPSDVGLRLELVNVSRAVCRFACSNIHDNQCSGFLYSRPGRLCTLSPYTGERLPSAPLVCDPTNEFYRRSRLLSKLQCDVSHTSLALLCSPG